MGSSRQLEQIDYSVEAPTATLPQNFSARWFCRHVRLLSLVAPCHSLVMSKDNRLAARLALKAAQAGHAKGLNHLMVATMARAGIGGSLEEGESPFGTAGGDTPGTGAF
jgi:hypothetical protein